MNRKYYFFSLLLLIFVNEAFAQDNCGGAVTLCANSSTTRTTASMSVGGTDPALSCGDGVLDNNVWFTVIAFNNGNCTVTVNNINNNPGLDMEVYTGVCGSLVSTGQCASGNSGTGGTMSVTFATTAGTTYFIMVDGNSGNQESFDIIATTPDNAIVARPDANFDVNPSSGCGPINALLHNSTIMHGGTNITNDWRIDLGSYFPSSGADTIMAFNAIGTTSVTLRVCNQQCGCKTVSQDVVVQDLFPTISYLPPTGCVGTNIFFDGDATVQPDPPYQDPSVTDWDWDFGDPASGINNTANGQSVSHTFIGSGTSYSVRLIVQGTCGPDTAYTTINLLPKPIVNIIGPSEICEGEDLNLSSTVSNAALPVTYDWIGGGSFSCTNCPATIVSSLPAGGPYTITLSITDSLGCTGDTSMDVTVNELPTVFAGGFITVCRNDSAQLNAIAALGIPPYSYLWSPSAGLNSDTIFDPYTFNTLASTYCVTVTDSKGCTSSPDCVFIDQYPQPTVAPSSLNLCASQSPLDNTFVVNGAGPGSVYEWGLSTSYFLINGAAVDSSDITATFPPVPGSYDFTVVVSDAVTGCIDTVATSFTIDAGLSMSVIGPTLSCGGDSVTLSVTGANTYTWSASPVYAFADPADSIQTVLPPVNTIFTIDGVQGTCTQTITHTLSVFPKPTVVINPIPPFCGCATVSLDGVGSSPGMSYLWTSSNGSVIASPTSLVTTATVCGADSLTLTVTDLISGCADSLTVVTLLRPKPDAQITVTPDLICNGVATLIALDGTGSDTNPGTTYAWSSSPAVVITDTTLLVTDATVNAATVFTLTVTDIGGCDSTVSDTVQIYPQPTFTANAPFLCTSDPVLTSSLDITGASPGSTFNWTTIPICVTPASANTASQVFDFTTCGPGVYNFDVTVTDAVTTCVTNVSATVTVVSGVVLSVSTDTSFCEGGTAIIYASGANSFVWSSGELTDTVTISALTSAGSPYVYTVTGTIGSCTASDSVQVTVNPVPATSAITGPVSVCENDPASVYSVTPPVGNYTWAITGGTIVAGQGSSNVVVNWNSFGVGFLSVVDTNAFGCAGPLQSLNIIINPLPDTPIVTGPASVCENAYATYFVNANAGSTYNWSITGGVLVLGPTGPVNVFQWGNAGPGTLGVFEVSAAGCIGPPANYNVTINPRTHFLPVSGSTLVCDNIQEIYSVTANPGAVYSWVVTNDSSNTVNVATDSLTVNWGIPGTGNVSVFETNSFGCNSDTNIFNVSVSQHPQTTIPNDTDTVCNNTPFQIVANSTTATVHWYTDGSGTFNDTTVASAIYQPAPSDSGFIHLYMVAVSSPCADDTALMTLYIYPSPVVTITGPIAPICYGTIDSLRATGGGTYIWTPGGIPSPVIGIRPLITTTYTVAVTNGYSCTTYDSITVDVIPPGIPDAGLNQIVCLTDSIFLNGTQQNAGGLLWSTLGDGTFFPNNTGSAVSYLPGVVDTTVNSVDIILVTTGACLNLTDTINIIIQHPPSINAGNDTTLSSSPTAGITLPLIPTAVNVSGVIWTTSGTGTFSPSDTSLNAVYTPSTSDLDLDSVIITVTTTGSCTPVSDALTIDFAPLIIPNVFTPYPASPGQNDFFVIRYLTPNTTLKIWDRWGKLVYTSDYYQNDWDAYGLKADVYYYVVISEDKDYKGWVQVFRGE